MKLEFSYKLRVTETYETFERSIFENSDINLKNLGKSSSEYKIIPYVWNDGYLYECSLILKIFEDIDDINGYFEDSFCVSRNSTFNVKKFLIFMQEIINLDEDFMYFDEKLAREFKSLIIKKINECKKRECELKIWN